MDSGIVEQAKENLVRALRLEASTQLPDAGWRWQAYRTATQRFVNYFRTPIEVIHAIQSPRSNMGYEARMTGRGLVNYARTVEQACLRIFPQYADKLGSFKESPLSHPETLAYLNNRLVSSPLYNHVVQIMRCATMVQPDIVMEIGGGYGAPGRLWLTNDVCRPRIYIDVDFPESLFFTEVYLRANDPSLHVEYLRAEADIERILNRPDAGPTVILVPIALIGALRAVPIDLAVNTGSLQEMTADYVEFYCRWLDTSNVGHFYSSNYFGQQIDNLFEGMNYVAPTMTDRWTTKFRCLHEDPLRPVAEVMFCRTPEESLRLHRDQASSKCQSLLDDSADPITLSTFLELFDLSRFSIDARLLGQICDRAAMMKATPKEALPLAKRYLETVRINHESLDQLEKAEALLASLTGKAEAGKSKMGIVDATVEKFKKSLMNHTADAYSLGGSFLETTDGTSIELTGSVRVIREGIYGAIERKEFNYNHMLISGWARSERSADPIVAVHVFIDGRLVESVEPDILRLDFGIPDLRCGFEMKTILPMDLAEGRHCFIFAEFQDKTLGKLANGGDL